MDRLDAFTSYRPLLFSLAYRMLGSVQDAEDLVQEAYLRWSQVELDRVSSPKDYLCTTVTRLCIDHSRSSRVHRESYVGIWLPEPLLTDVGPDPSDQTILGEELSTAFLFLLERLSPVERAVFLLRDVFDYDYAEIAGMVEKSAANCRQIARRARQRLAERESRFPISRSELESITHQFIHACTNGEMDGLMTLLAADVTLWSDGGGRARAALNPVHGADRVGRLLLGIQRKPAQPPRMLQANVNGQPGILRYIGGQLHSVITLAVAEGRIRQVFLVVNPEKLPLVPHLQVH